LLFSKVHARNLYQTLAGFFIKCYWKDNNQEQRDKQHPASLGQTHCVAKRRKTMVTTLQIKKWIKISEA